MTKQSTLKPGEPIAVHPLETVKLAAAPPIGLELARKMLKQGAQGSNQGALDALANAQRATNAKLQATTPQPQAEASSKDVSDAMRQARAIAAQLPSSRELMLRNLEQQDAKLFLEVIKLLPQLTEHEVPKPVLTAEVLRRPAAAALDFEAMPELKQVLAALPPGEQLTVKQVRAAAGTDLLTRSYLDQLVAARLVRARWTHGRGVYEITEEGAAELE